MNEAVNNKFSDFHERVWERGWEDHRRRQMERLAALPLSDKLVWLEEAHRLLLHMRSKPIASSKRD